MQRHRDRLADVTESINEHLNKLDAARESAYRLQRETTRVCASTIRAVHRGELDEASELLAEARRLKEAMNDSARRAPAVYFNGFVMDAQKEYAEAAVVLAVMQGRELPDVAELDIEPSAYLNGLAEAATELRRTCLDALQRNDTGGARRLVAFMGDVYSLLVTFDFPDSLTYGLKRRLDVVRGVFERTQSDVISTTRGMELQTALERLERRLAAVE